MYKIFRKTRGETILYSHGVKEIQASNGIMKSVCKISRQNLASNVGTTWIFSITNSGTTSAKYERSD